MAKWGSVDYKKLKQLREQLDRFDGRLDRDAFCRECVRELAARLLALVIPATPTGKYPKATGKKGGTLKRGWVSKTHAAAAEGTGKTTVSAGKAYANSLTIQHSGNTYMIDVINPVEYASYVEFGHRTRGGNGWVPGRYMLTISEKQLQQITPALLEKKLNQKLKEVFNV